MEQRSDSIVDQGTVVLDWLHQIVHLIVLSVRLVIVIVEVALRRERTLAPLGRAVVRLLARVQPQVCLQVPLLIEGFTTVFEGTHKVTLAFMLLQMHFQALLPTVGLVAALDRANKVLGLLVSLHVVPQVALGHERLFASWEIALKRSKVLELCTQKRE